LYINHIDFVTAMGKLFSSIFEMFGAHVALSFGIRPLKRHRDELHQVVHEHPPTFLWIEQGMGEPGVNAAGPLLQIQIGKRRAINLLQS